MLTGWGLGSVCHLVCDVTRLYGREGHRSYGVRYYRTALRIE